MATNIKGRIIIGSALVVVVGITSYVIFSGLRKRKVLKNIYEAIRDTKSAQGQQALLNEENQLLGSDAFDPNFWKGKGTVKPDPNLLMPTKMAREIATKIYELFDVISDDEKAIISQIKKLKSKGQISQVASAYANAPLNYGELGNDITDALTGWTDSEVYITQLTSYVNNLPN